jgi:hypothetical protein
VFDHRCQAYELLGAVAEQPVPAERGTP